MGGQRKGGGMARRMDRGRLGSDSQMGMQAQTGHLNTAALQQWTAKRQRQADRGAIDIVAQRQERRAVEGEVQQTVRALLEEPGRAGADPRGNESPAFVVWGAGSS